MTGLMPPERCIFLTLLLAICCNCEGQSDRPLFSVGPHAPIKTKLIDNTAGFWRKTGRFESNHPYQNDTTQTWALQPHPKGTQTKLIIHRLDLENNYDWFSVTPSEQTKPTAITGNLLGRTLIFEQTKLVVRLESDYSNVGWGVDFETWQWIPCTCSSPVHQVCGIDGQTYQAVCEAKCAAVEVAHDGACEPKWVTLNRSFDSPHPYSANMSETYIIQAPGAKNIRLIFDRLDFESGYDFLHLHDDAGAPVQTYTHSAQNTASPVIEGDTAHLRLVSDYSVETWGFRISKIEAESSCLHSTDCAPGYDCITANCGEQRCYRRCIAKPVLPVNLQDLLSSPKQFDNLRIRVEAKPDIENLICTRRACPDNNACCNDCVGNFEIGHHLMLFNGAENAFCSGTECDWQAGCTPFPAPTPGRYALTGVFRHGPYGAKRLLLEHKTPLGCHVTGNGTQCANKDLPVTSKLPVKLDCYRHQSCVALPDGTCGWANQNEIDECLSPPHRGPFLSTDTPIDVLDPPGQTTRSHLLVNTTSSAANKALLTLKLTHSFIGDLHIELTPPAGKPVVLHHRTGGSTNFINLDKRPLNQLEGSASGTWLLTIVDHARWDTGILNAWQLDFF